MILKRGKEELTTREVLPAEQLGCPEKPSTVLHILRLVQFAGARLNRKQVTGAIFFDMENVYDKTWQEGLVFNR